MDNSLKTKYLHHTAAARTVKGASKRPPQLDPGRRFYKLGEVWMLCENGRNGLKGSMSVELIRSWLQSWQ